MYTDGDWRQMSHHGQFLGELLLLGATVCCSIVRPATARTTTMTSPPPPRCRKSAQTHFTVMRGKRVQIHTFPYSPTAIMFHVNHVTQHASKLSVRVRVATASWRTIIHCYKCSLESVHNMLPTQYVGLKFPYTSIRLSLTIA